MMTVCCTVHLGEIKSQFSFSREHENQKMRDNEVNAHIEPVFCVYKIISILFLCSYVQV